MVTYDGKTSSYYFACMSSSHPRNACIPFPPSRIKFLSQPQRAQRNASKRGAGAPQCSTERRRWNRTTAKLTPHCLGSCKEPKEQGIAPSLGRLLPSFELLVPCFEKAAHLVLFFICVVAAPRSTLVPLAFTTLGHSVFEALRGLFVQPFCLSSF